MVKQIISSVCIDARAYFKGGNVKFRIFSPPSTVPLELQYVVNRNRFITGLNLKGSQTQERIKINLCFKTLLNNVIPNM